MTFLTCPIMRKEKKGKAVLERIWPPDFLPRSQGIGHVAAEGLDATFVCGGVVRYSRPISIVFGEDDGNAKVI